MSGRTSSDGDVYVGRHNSEIGKINLDGNKFYNIWCHHGGSSDCGDLLVLANGVAFEWVHFKSGDRLPDGAVCGGQNAKDGYVYVARERGSGACGKLNVNDDGTCCNLWVHGSMFAWKEGDALVVKPLSCGGGWNPKADCDGICAEERSLWLQKEQGKSVEEAQRQVMKEFPLKFGLMWNPSAMCDGLRAEERSLWLQKEQGMTVEEAQAQVMSEFPAIFSKL
jgi:hypothetical protein